MILKEKLSLLKEKALSLLGYFFKPNKDYKGLVCIQINQEGLSIILAKIKPSLQILNCQYFTQIRAIIPKRLFELIEKKDTAIQAPQRSQKPSYKRSAVSVLLILQATLLSLNLYIVAILLIYELHKIGTNLILF